MIICEIIVHLLVTIQNNKRCTIQVSTYWTYKCYVPLYQCLPEYGDLSLGRVGEYMNMDDL